MSVYTIQGVLAADVANGGTFTVNYPQGTNKGTFTGAVQHGLSIGGRDLVHFDQFLAAPGASNVTITNRSGSTWAAGGAYVLGLEVPGPRDVRDENGKNPILRANSMRVVQINLGAPIAAAATGVSASQSVGVGAAFLLNGSLLAGGRMVFDVPRNVVAAWTGTSVITVTGKDEYGNTVVESSASGTTFAGKKAFKEITRVTSSAAITLATVGTGDVFGLPLFVETSGLLLKELQDGVAATAGTLVVADSAKATATTGDVRGTYDPNAAADGSRSFQLWLAESDPAYRGPAQFAG